MTQASRRRPSHTVLVAHPSAELYGSDRVMLESVSGLVDDGWRVVVTVPSDGPLLSELRARGASVELCPSPVLRKNVLTPRGFARFVATSLSSTVHGMSLLRRERPALVYVNTITVPLWPVLARLAGVPVLTHVHEGEASASHLMRRLLALPLFLSRTLLVNSRFSAGVLSTSFESLGRRAQVVYNAVPGPSRRTPPRATLAGPLRVTYIGRLSPRKGVDVAVDAVARLRDRGVHAELDVVGSVFPGYEWYQEELASSVGSKDLDGRVRFHGFQPSVWDIVGSGDVVVVPSRVDEPFGNTAVEALLAARPVIASATSGLLEATAGYQAAVTVRPDDAAALADALERTVGAWEATAEAVTADAEEAERRHSVATYRSRISALARATARR
ncbi:MAG: glycosyltransferase [Leifsonia sp.]